LTPSIIPQNRRRVIYIRSS